MRVRDVAGGGRAITVAPQRIARWFDGFEQRNGGVERTVFTSDALVVYAADGTTATVTPPFEQFDDPREHTGLAVDALVEYANHERRIGLVLARLGAHSVGVAVGERVVSSRTSRHLVHGRNSAGGWSQQRFARRRDKQAREALERAAADIADVLEPELTSLDAVVLGGDRRALDELRTDRRLAPVFAMAVPWVLELGEPRRALLDEAAVRARAIEVVVREP